MDGTVYIIITVAVAVLLGWVALDMRKRRKKDAPVIKSVYGMDNRAVRASRDVC